MEKDRLFMDDIPSIASLYLPEKLVSKTIKTIDKSKIEPVPSYLTFQTDYELRNLTRKITSKINSYLLATIQKLAFSIESLGAAAIRTELRYSKKAKLDARPARYKEKTRSDLVSYTQ